MTTTWFTADTHFNWGLILKVYIRPFTTIDEMNEALITNWNERVKPKDTVYLLGDVAFGSIEQADACLDQLHGRKVLLFGNHDRRTPALTRHFEAAYDIREAKVTGQKLFMCHYPMRSWHHSGKGVWHLHGHTHGGVGSEGLLRYDVGVTCNDFRPLSMDEVGAIMEKLK